MRFIRRHLLIMLAAVLLTHVSAPTALAQSAGKIRFGVGPLQPTPAETTKAYKSFFAYLAKKLDRDFDLVATTDARAIEQIYARNGDAPSRSVQS